MNNRFRTFIAIIVFVIIFLIISGCNQCDKIPEEDIIGYRKSDLEREVPKIEWRIDELITFSNGLSIVLNNVWKETQYDYIYVVINITLKNTTDKLQEDGNTFSLPAFFMYLYDSEDNKFLGNGCLKADCDTVYEAIDNLSPGTNKKWPAGKELSGNIYFHIPEQAKEFTLELSYSEFLRVNKIYCYKFQFAE